MGKTGLSGIILTGVLLLASCAAQSPCGSLSDCAPRPNLWHETRHHALYPFNNPRPPSPESGSIAHQSRPEEPGLYKSTVSAGQAGTIVRVPAFTDLSINGCFQTQIDGGQNQNSLYIVGTQDVIRQIPVEIHGKSIYIGQLEGSGCLYSLRNVIIRIGIHRLNRLAVYGGGNVQGRHIASDGLTVLHYGNADIVLQGHFPVQNILLAGNGNLTLIGADTTHLTIDSRGSGNLHMSGRIGLDCIHHTGNGQIYILNAWSRHLNLDATGNSTTTLLGSQLNLTGLAASNNSRVYITGVNSSYIRVTESDFAEVGLSGYIDTLEASLKDYSYFWGAGLHAGSTYIDTRNAAHANVLAHRRLFAKASDNSTIYYCAPSDGVSTYWHGRALILPMCLQNTNAGWTRVYK